MSRRFWGGLMFASLLIAAGSAYLLYSELIQGNATHSEPAPNRLLSSEPPAGPPPDAAVQSTGTAVAVSTPTPAVDVSTPVETAAAPERTASRMAKRNILFSLHRPNAKKVYVIGDFNKWYRQPMKKRGKMWQRSVSLAPGRYEYMFIVDDKRIADPNNKTASSDKSVLVVKPLSN